ncbi:MAG TPA: M15 family metallopeptidase [Longimicrobiaceae bacterium]|nr:M15 family metallopeptidase [Longimicrobiaceae bacterium]
MRPPHAAPRLLLALALAQLAACAPSATRSASREGCPPVARGTLVDVRSLDRSIRVEVLYATPENFTGAPLPGYERPRALLRPEAASALARVQRRLERDGLGLKVWDAYRPVRATRAMVEWAERTGNRWVIEQGYVAERSGHNRGGTVDLTLVDHRSGRELEMGTGYDYFSPAAHTANAGGEVQENRERLVRAMEAEGFTNYPKEWWHFSYAGEWEPLDVPIRCF